MKVTNLRKYDGDSKTKAFFAVETDEGMVVKGFRLVQGQDGLFMSNPSEYSKKDDKYYDRVYIPRELKDELEQEAIRAYGGTTPPNGDGAPF